MKIRYHDFSTHSSARTIEPTNDDTIVYRTARELLRGTSARGAMWWALWLLSFIPGGAVRFAARLRRRLRV